jgi:TP901 family phage tail tape measure protein
VSDKIAGGIKKGFMAAGVAMVAFGAAAKKVIEIGADFERKLVGATVKMPGKIRKGSEAYKEVEDAVRKVGSQTEFSATQAADAVGFLAMAGFDAQKSIAALPGVVNLATVAGLELGEATDIATDSLGAFGLASDDAATQAKNLAIVNDSLASISTSANTSIQDMFEAIKEGATTATKSGASIHTFNAMVASMANAGIKGSKAGTTLKNVFLNLQAPAAAGRKALMRLFGKRSGWIHAAGKLKGKLKDPIKLMDALKDKLSKFGEAKQAGILKDIFGKIALPGALVLLADGTKKLDKFRQISEKSTGQSKEMAAVMRDTVGGSIDSMKSAIEGVVISLFKLQDGGIKRTIDRMVEWIRVNEELIVTNIGGWLESFVNNFDKIVDTVEKAAIVLGTGGAFFIAIKGLETLAAAFALGPIGAAFIGVTLAVSKAVIDMREQGRSWEEILLQMKIATISALNDIKGAVNTFTGVLNFLEEQLGGGAVAEAFTGKKFQPTIGTLGVTDLTAERARLNELATLRHEAWRKEQDRQEKELAPMLEKRAAAAERLREESLSREFLAGRQSVFGAQVDDTPGFDEQMSVPQAAPAGTTTTETKDATVTIKLQEGLDVEISEEDKGFVKVAKLVAETGGFE